MGTSHELYVLLDFAENFDDKKLMILFAIVVAIILIDSEIVVVSDLSQRQSRLMQEYCSLSIVS